jgi:hypothetical protein
MLGYIDSCLPAYLLLEENLDLLEIVGKDNFEVVIFIYLSLFLGMNSCDILALKFDDIVYQYECEDKGFSVVNINNQYKKIKHVPFRSERIIQAIETQKHKCPASTYIFMDYCNENNFITSGNYAKSFDLTTEHISMSLAMYSHVENLIYKAFGIKYEAHKISQFLTLASPPDFLGKLSIFKDKWNESSPKIANKWLDERTDMIKNIVTELRCVLKDLKATEIVE